MVYLILWPNAVDRGRSVAGANALDPTAVEFATKVVNRGSIANPCSAIYIRSRDKAPVQASGRVVVP